MNWLEEPCTVHRTSLRDLSDAINDYTPHEEPTRFDIISPEFVIPMLVIKRERADRLIVLNNGAVDLARSQGKPIFQRSSWWQEIDGHQIYVCDPGTVGPEALPLNWMQSAPPLWANSQISKAVRIIANQLGVRNPANRKYFGSSAGGYAALLQLCADKKASCLINNAQFDWTRWFAHQVSPVLHKHFAGSTAAVVRRSLPHRVNALQYLGRKPLALNIEYHVNMASKYDVEVQLPIFENFFSSNRSICGSIVTHKYYDDEQGHNPLQKPITLDLLNSRRLK